MANDRRVVHGERKEKEANEIVSIKKSGIYSLSPPPLYSIDMFIVIGPFLCRLLSGNIISLSSWTRFLPF
jgi:hypothetical protein